jgi:hypothetical protein
MSSTVRLSWLRGTHLYCTNSLTLRNNRYSAGVMRAFGFSTAVGFVAPLPRMQVANSTITRHWDSVLHVLTVRLVSYSTESAQLADIISLDT